MTTMNRDEAVLLLSAMRLHSSNPPQAAALDLALRSLSSPPAVPEGEWRPMDTAPRDGTLIRLLVRFTDHATEDTSEPCPTIGAWPATGDDDSAFQFAGWCWTHDHFCEGQGEPIGWLPMLAAAAPPSEPPKEWDGLSKHGDFIDCGINREDYPSPAEQGAREDSRTMPWRREWHGSTDRGWHIVEAVRPSHNKRIAYLGECPEAAVDAIIAAHNATAVRSPDCVWGCPANTVCDYCQRAPLAAGRVGVADEQCVRAIEARNAYLSSPAGKQSGNAIHAMRAALEAALAGPVVAGEVVADAWVFEMEEYGEWIRRLAFSREAGMGHNCRNVRPLVYADTAKGAK